MNDFTKEELQILCIELNINLNRSKARKLNVPQSMLDLIKKINSMIDEYCEPCNHEFHSTQNELPLAITVCCGEELTYTNTTWSIPK